MVFLLVATGVFGAIVGSFLNVVILRMNTGVSLGGRSHCFSCRTTLRWFELIPVLSFLFQRGRCRTCGSRISKQYVIVEAITAGLFVGVAAKYGTQLLALDVFGWITFIALLVLVAACIVLSVYDIYHKIVPDRIVLPFVVFSFLSIFFTTVSPWMIGGVVDSFPWSRLLAGLLIPLPFLILWIVSKGRLMGFGDIKIMAGIGWLLGASAGVSAVILAFWIGAALSLMVLGGQRVAHLFPRTKRFIMSTEIPFAPFLAIGLYIVLLTEFNVLTLLVL